LNDLQPLKVTAHGTITVFDWVVCALKYPSAPLLILDEGLAGEAEELKAPTPEDCANWKK
jgi:hypothetical protein